ncbi:MAG: DUF3574 domain-containing protein [Clostridiales bacterium]|nr:DUF3574 domain-containing protein [Clostridiales bacterium]
MQKHKTIYILLIANLLLCAFILLTLFPVSCGTRELKFTEDDVYILYIGLNDKDTYAQIIPTDEAVALVNAICLKYASGYTMQFAQGGWTDETGTLTQEDTLVYTIAYADERAILSIMDEVLAALNQNSILVERRGTASAYYEGRP